MLFGLLLKRLVDCNRRGTKRLGIAGSKYVMVLPLCRLARKSPGKTHRYPDAGPAAFRKGGTLKPVASFPVLDLTLQ